jgi:hypothetical protein
MTLERVERPDGGSLSVVFACATCGNQVAMLTNPGETQLLRALDVRIGGRASLAEPMQFVRSMLASGREVIPHAQGLSAAASDVAPTSGCPFSAMLGAADVPSAGREVPSAEHAVPGIRPAARTTPEVTWSPEAECRLERIPEFIRPMVRQGIEHFAAARGYPRITESVMDEARGALGM